MNNDCKEDRTGWSSIFCYQEIRKSLLAARQEQISALERLDHMLSLFPPLKEGAHPLEMMENDDVDLQASAWLSGRNAFEDSEGMANMTLSTFEYMKRYNLLPPTMHSNGAFPAKHERKTFEAEKMSSNFNNERVDVAKSLWNGKDGSGGIQMKEIFADKIERNTGNSNISNFLNINAPLNENLSHGGILNVNYCDNRSNRHSNTNNINKNNNNIVADLNTKAKNYMPLYSEFRNPQFGPRFMDQNVILNENLIGKATKPSRIVSFAQEHNNYMPFKNEKDSLQDSSKILDCEGIKRLPKL